MRLLTIAFLFTAISGCAQLSPHPRIYLDAATLANATAKYHANHADWQAIKTEADVYANASIYSITPVAGTNSPALELTIAEPVVPFGVTAKRSNNTLVNIVVASDVATVNFSASQSLAANVNNILHIRGSSTPGLNGNFQVTGGSGTAWRVTAPGVPNGTYNESALTVSYGSDVCIFATNATGPWASLMVSGSSSGYFVHRASDTSVAVYLLSDVGGGTTGAPVNSSSWGAFNGTWQTALLNGNSSTKIVYTFQTSGWYKALRSLVPAYLMTGNAAYANKALQLLDYINGFVKLGGPTCIGPILKDRGYPTRFAAYALAFTYDWLNPLLSPAQKTETANTANAWFDWYKNRTVINGNAIYQPAGYPAGNYWGGHVLGFGLLGYATHGDNPRAQEIIDYVRTDFDASMALAFQQPADGIRYGPTQAQFADGQLVQGYNYAPAHVARLLQYMNTIRTATGENVFSGTDWAQKFARATIYNLKPNNWEATREGDFATTFAGVMPKAMPEMLAYVLAGTAEGGWMQFMLGRMGGVPAGGINNQAVDPLEKFLFDNSGRTSIDYTQTEPAYYAEASGTRLYYRSDWTPNAVWSSFTGGQVWYSDHQDLSMGHVEVTRGSDNLFPTVQEWNGANGYSGTPGNSSAAAVQNVNSNSLQFSDGGAYGNQPPTYDGGAGYWGSFVKPKYKVGAGYVYGLSDLTSVYDRSNPNPTNRTLRYYFRAYTALGDGTFVVFDRSRVKDASYSQKIRWQMNGVNGPPANPSGNIWKVTAGSSAGYIIPVLPADGAAAVTMANNLYGTSYANSAYHVDIANATPGTDLAVLTVLYATSSEESAPPLTALGTAGTAIDANFAGVQINDTVPKVYVHAATVEEHGDTYSSKSLARATFTTTHAGIGKYVIGGLEPGSYDVIWNGQRYLTQQTVGEDGTLSFTAASGAFTIGGAYKVNASPFPLPTAVVGIAYLGALFLATGGTAPYTYSVTGLPEGLTADAQSGALSGTPTTQGTATVTVRATDSTGAETTASFDLTVTLPELIFVTGTLPATTVGANYSLSMTASGGDGAYKWGVISGGLPPGMTLSEGGLIAGIPSRAGVYVLGISVTSGDGQTAAAALRLVVNSGPPSTLLRGAKLSGGKIQ